LEKGVGKLLKGLIDKLFKQSPPSTQRPVQPISPEEVEALVDAKIKEHAATIQTTVENHNKQTQSPSQEDYTLTAKQIDYALTLIDKVKNEFELAIDPTQLTIKDLNRLIAYQRYKNKGTLINLVKKGVLKRK
jgi:hypothetical protein